MNTSLFQKYLIALSGLFLCIFLIIHLAGNLPLLLPPAQAEIQFNWYADLLSSLIIIKLIAWVLYLTILLHITYAIMVSLQNRRANGTVKYAYDRRAQASPWQSRYMGFLGIIILLFLIIHFQQFWYDFQFGSLPLDAEGNKNLFKVVISIFQQPWYVGLYLLSFAALGFHLWHGFYSAFRTLGVYHPTPARLLRMLGMLYTVVIIAGFSIIALYVHFTY